jgi:ribosomal-protein-alanine N-acetyltransferase
MPGELPEVELEPLSLAAREEFIVAMEASRDLHEPWVSPPLTPAGFEALVDRRSGSRSDYSLVRRCEDGALVGYFDISEIIRGPFRSAYLGYGGVAAHAGRGYMSAGMRLLLRRAFTELGLNRLEANIQPSNEASIALVRSAGFVREGFSERYLKLNGRWRDHERWAIHAERWKQHKRLESAR